MIDEGYSSKSPRTSLCTSDSMDYSDSLDNAEIDDAVEQLANATTKQFLDTLFLPDQQSLIDGSSSDIFSSIDRSILESSIPHPHPSCKASYSSEFGTSSAPSITASSTSLVSTSYHDRVNVVSVGLSNSGGASTSDIFATSLLNGQNIPGGAVSQCCVVQGEPQLSSSIAATLPPIQRSSTAPIPLCTHDFTQSVIQVPFGWSANGATMVPQHSISMMPSGIQQVVDRSGPQQGAVGVSILPANMNELMNPLFVNNSFNSGDCSSATTSNSTSQLPSTSDERRIRNNEASRRSRYNQKAKTGEQQIKLYQLELENLSLKKSVDEVSKMVRYMKEKLVEYMQSKG